MAETTEVEQGGNRGVQGPVVAVSGGCVVARRGSVQIYYKVTNLVLRFVLWQCKKRDKNWSPGSLE